MADVLTEHNSPNQRCTCGWKRFRETTSSEDVDTTCWIFYDTASGSGFGATEFGLFFGAGTSGAWGEFDVTIPTTQLEVRCENCRRIRLTKRVSDGKPVGGYISGEFVYVVICGATTAGCYSIEFRGPDGVTVSAALSFTSVPAQPLILPGPPITGPLPSPPPAGDVARLLRARIPPVPISGDYDVVLVDRCGPEILLDTLFLEVDVVVLNPLDADLNGIPEQWLRFAGGPTGTAVQDSGQVLGIPFDYCQTVIEYDSRFGTPPNLQGWTHQNGGGGSGAPGDWTIVDGNVLSSNTPGSGNPSYWEQTIPENPHVAIGVAAYAVWTGPQGAHAAPGEGFDFQGLIGVNGVPYSGVRFTSGGGNLFQTQLDGSGDTAWAGDDPGPDWRKASAIRGSFPSSRFTYGEGYDTGSVHGNTVAAAGANEIVARFGDVIGNGVQPFGAIRNFVVSSPNRFTRAWFRAYATVASPVLRLYVHADQDPTENLARFLVRYGANTPYEMPTNQASATVNFSARQTTFEVPLNLAGLTAGQPFWFTVEREWNHADDRTLATVWLTQATVRAA